MDLFARRSDFFLLSRATEHRANTQSPPSEPATSREDWKIPTWVRRAGSNPQAELDKLEAALSRTQVAILPNRPNGLRSRGVPMDKRHPGVTAESRDRQYTETQAREVQTQPINWRPVRWQNTFIHQAMGCQLRFYDLMLRGYRVLHPISVHRIAIANYSMIAIPAVAAMPPTSKSDRTNRNPCARIEPQPAFPSASRIEFRRSDFAKE